MFELVCLQYWNVQNCPLHGRFEVLNNCIVEIRLTNTNCVLANQSACHEQNNHHNEI